MPVYETTFIINPQTDDATIDSQVTAITDLITKNDGKIVYEDRMGTRRLAYEIAGLTQGYYASIYYDAAHGVPSILDRYLRLEEAYIRHLTVVFEGEVEKLGVHEEPEERPYEHFSEGRRPFRGGGRRRDDRPAPGRSYSRDDDGESGSEGSAGRSRESKGDDE